MGVGGWHGMGPSKPIALADVVLQFFRPVWIAVNVCRCPPSGNPCRRFRSPCQASPACPRPSGLVPWSWRHTWCIRSALPRLSLPRLRGLHGLQPPRDHPKIEAAVYCECPTRDFCWSPPKKGRSTYILRRLHPTSEGVSLGVRWIGLGANPRVQLPQYAHMFVIC